MRENHIDESPRISEFTADASTVPSDWAVGDVILDTYEVKRIHEGGGMGLVYRVYHRGWNMDLAVKSPRPDYFRTENQKQLFVSECETWSALGLHPHIVNCFYVRTLGGIPRVFAEYVEGGSLHDWIKSRRHYKGSLRENLKTILDIAIQMAWGLDYAHEQGLIHQDVKPGNVLMTPDGSAKISDFGLAKARGAISDPSRETSTRSIVVTNGGMMTRAYCSPEQARGETLTRRTDIWSWAVSVLEMIVGGVIWQAGPLAAEVLADLDQHVPAEHLRCFVPAKLKELLGKCLRTEQVHRPHDFAAIVDALLELFQTEFRMPFQRTLPDKLDLDADTLNNRMVSCVDLGKVLTKGAQNAFSLLFDLRRKRPDHIQGWLNDALIQWRKVGLSVQDLNRWLDNAMQVPSYTHDFLKWQIRLELEKSDTCRAMRILSESSYSGDKQSLLAQVGKWHETLHRKFIAFFSEDKRHGRPLAYQELAASDDRLRSSIHAMTGGQTGIAAVAQEDGASIRLFDIKNNRQIATLDPPHHFSKIAFSELGSFLAIADASVDTDVGSESERSYRFSVCRPFSFGGWTTYSGIVPKYVRLKAATIDDQCLCATLWLEHNNRMFELIHDLRDGNLRPFRCDFRKPSHVGAFDQIFLSGDRTLLLAVNGSRCSLWRYPSATCDDGMNALDIDLADFGLIDTTGHLPGFALVHGFEDRIDDWNALRLMRLLNESCSKTHAEYLLCRPADTSHLFGVRSTKEKLLRLADDAERANNRAAALRHLNCYCALISSHEDPVMSRRHELAQALPGAHLERAWHHSSHNWYWEANVIDIRSDDKDRMTLQWSSKQETVPLPSMNVCKGKQAEDGGYNDRVTRRLIDRFASSRQSWQSDCGVLDQLAPIEAIAKDMSAVVGWASPHQLVHIRMNDLKVTEIWNIWDSKYPDISHTLHELQDFRTLFVKIAMSSCGRAVCYVLWDYVVVIDVMTGNLVLIWRRPWDSANALAFDSSGRWVVYAHAENQFEVFHLFWNAGCPSLKPAD